MIHLYAFVVFVGVLAVIAVAVDVDQRLRDRYSELDEAPDLCRGAQRDRTPDMRKAPPVAASEARIRNTTSQQH